MYNMLMQQMDQTKIHYSTNIHKSVMNRTKYIAFKSSKSLLRALNSSHANIKNIHNMDNLHSFNFT